jgi:hypothetical protein
LRLLSSPDRDSAVGPRLAWNSGRISARAIGMIAEAALNPHGGYERPRRFRASLPRGHQSQGRSAQAGYLMAVQFGPMGAARGHDAFSGVMVAAGRAIAFVVSKSTA